MHSEELALSLPGQNRRAKAGGIGEGKQAPSPTLLPPRLRSRALSSPAAASSLTPAVSEGGPAEPSCRISMTQRKNKTCEHVRGSGDDPKLIV